MLSLQLTCAVQLLSPLPSQTSNYVCGNRPLSWLKLFLLYCSYFVIVLPALRVTESHTAARPGTDAPESAVLTRLCMQTNILGGCFRNFQIRLPTGHVDSSGLQHVY